MSAWQTQPCCATLSHVSTASDNSTKLHKNLCGIQSQIDTQIIRPVIVHEKFQENPGMLSSIKTRCRTCLKSTPG